MERELEAGLADRLELYVQRGEDHMYSGSSSFQRLPTRTLYDKYAHELVVLTESETGDGWGSSRSGRSGPLNGRCLRALS